MVSGLAESGLGAKKSITNHYHWRPGHPHPRQLGYLLEAEFNGRGLRNPEAGTESTRVETRSFPPPSFNGFGFTTDLK
jgi:Ni/Co efflux regulator RcnB